MYNNVSPVYQKIRTKDGTYQLKIVGETDHVQAIQSHRDEVDLRQLLQRASVTGDYSRIRGNAGVYADIADMPRSFNDAQKLAASLPQRLAELPIEVKEAFPSYEAFVTSVVNGTTKGIVLDYLMKKNAAAVSVKKGDAE